MPVENYNPRDYPPFAVTVDLNVFTVRDGVLKVLLVERGNDPFKHFWALPGGFVGVDESAEQAASRELFEETGIDLDWVNYSQNSGEDLIYLEQLGTFSKPDRDPRMRVVSISYIAFAADLPDPVAGDDAANARWWSIDDIFGDFPEVELAFDHETILSEALDRVRSKLEYTTLATQFVPEVFTLSDLWRVYAAVWGEAPLLSNFRRKVLSVDGFVEPAGGETKVSTGQKALLYKHGSASRIYPPFLRNS